MDSKSIKAQLKPWSGYFQRNLDQRRDELMNFKPKLPGTQMLSTGGLEPEVADMMIENCVGVLGLPIGVAPTFYINDKHYVVPMCVEEPSVIAAAAGAGKLIATLGGGFTATATGNIMVCQVQLLDVKDTEKACAEIKEQEEFLVAQANRFCPNMRKRGGGVRAVKTCVRTPRDQNPYRGSNTVPFVVVHFEVDVCDAMGANLVNTVAEGMAPHLERITGARAGLKILTNLCLQRKAKASFKMPLSALAWKGADGETVAKRVVEAYYFAVDDHFRATTNNKGIMNGIDAVAIATGQDWRAIEAGAHAYASRNGYYSPLTSYKIIEPTDEPDAKTCGGGYLVGELEMPISVGTVGGALNTHPLYKFSHLLLDKPDARTLAQIIVCVGLAQNFAAVRALAIQGIQAGHMALHARNVAVSAGVDPLFVPQVTSYMVKCRCINTNGAKAWLTAYSTYQRIIDPAWLMNHPEPSTLYIELPTAGSNPPLRVTLLTPAIGVPEKLIISPNIKPHPMQNELFGPAADWLNDLLSALSYIHPKPSSSSPPPSPSNESTPNTPTSHLSPAHLKLLVYSILLQTLATRLMKNYPAETSAFLNQLLLQTSATDDIKSKITVPSTLLENHVPEASPVLAIGLPLIASLLREIDYFIFVDDPTHPELAQLLSKRHESMLSDIAAGKQSPSQSAASAIEFKDPETLLTNFQNMWPASISLLVSMFVASTKSDHSHSTSCSSSSSSSVTASSSSSCSSIDSPMNFITKLGMYLECEGKLAHDVAQARALLSSASSSETKFLSKDTNMYFCWVESKNQQTSQETLDDFEQILSDVCATKRNQIFSISSPSSPSSAVPILRTSQEDLKIIVDAIKQHYIIQSKM